MASKLNTEFNYRYQVIGDTAWEKIKTLKGFLEGRVRSNSAKHESRVIDIDVLLYEDMIINETNLVIPHPRMHLRNFVLYPLSDIAKSKIAK